MAATEFETIKLEVQDRIATLTLNRPDRLNAFNGQMMADMIKAFDVTDADDNVGAVIVTGAGRGFCAGADLAAGGETFNATARAEREPMRPQGDERMRDGGGLLTLRIFESLKPVIAPSFASAPYATT